MIRLILLIAIVTLLWWFIFKFKKLDNAEQKQMLAKVAIYGLALALLLLVITGRAHWLFALLAAILPWVKRALFVGGLFKKYAYFKEKIKSHNDAHKSSFEKNLEVIFNDQTGKLDAKIIAGQYKDQNLSTLNLKQIQFLVNELNADGESVNLIKAFAQISYPDKFNELSFDENQHTHTSSYQLSKKQAQLILGVGDNADKDQITKAHKKLIQKYHPDRGGSSYLSILINQAKKELLKNKV